MLSGHRRTVRRAGERGSALLLMPAGVLILLVLGAICVDTAALFLAERELANAAAAAANDAASAAVDRSSFYQPSGPEEPPPAATGAVVLDQGAAVAAAARSVDAMQLDRITITERAVDAVGDTVTVTLTASVPTVFAGAVGLDDTWEASASASATARRG